MVRGLKKKLLIGLLSAAVVGTSLAPSVPLVGSFAQEVKADEDTTASIPLDAVQDFSNAKTVTVKKPAHTTVTGGTVDKDNGKVTFAVAPDDGYVKTEGFTTSFDITVDEDKNIKESVFDVGGSVALAQIKLKAQKGDNALDGITWSFDKDTVDFATNKTAKLTITAKSGRKFEEAPTVTGLTGTLSSDKTKATYGIEIKDKPTSVETTNNYVITGGKYETLTTIKVDDSGLVGADVTLSKKEGITPDDTVTVTVTPKTGYTFENDPEVVGLNNVKLKSGGGKYVGTIPKGTFTSDDVTLKITGIGKFTSESKEEKTNDNGVKQTVNKKVESTAKVTTSPEGVYDAVKASGHISSELTTLASATEQRALDVSANIVGTDDVDAPIKTKVKDAKLNLGYAFVITITKKLNGATTGIQLNDLGNNLITFTISVPEVQRGKKNYAVYRMHNELAEVITTTPNAYGEYIEVSADTSTITLHASKFSTFAIAYGDDAEVVPDTPEPEPNTDDDNPAKEDDNNKGTITPTNGTTATTNTAKAGTSTKAAKVTTSTKKSSKTSSPKTADYAVNSLLALLTGAAGLFGITLINKKRKEDEE